MLIKYICVGLGGAMGLLRCDGSRQRTMVSLMKCMVTTLHKIQQGFTGRRITICKWKYHANKANKKKSNERSKSWTVLSSANGYYNNVSSVETNHVEQCRNRKHWFADELNSVRKYTANLVRQIKCLDININFDFSASILHAIFFCWQFDNKNQL